MRKQMEVEWNIGTENADFSELVKVTDAEYGLEIYFRPRDMAFFAYNPASEMFGSVGRLPASVVEQFNRSPDQTAAGLLFNALRG